MSASPLFSEPLSSFYQIDTTARQKQLQPVINEFLKAIENLASNADLTVFNLNTELLAKLLTDHLNAKNISPDNSLSEEQLEYQFEDQTCKLFYGDFHYIFTNRHDVYQHTQGVVFPNEKKLWKGCAIAKNGDTLTGTFDPHAGHLQDGFFEHKNGTVLNGTWVENQKTGRLIF